MGQIYENSQRTLIWLGLDDQGVALETFDFLKSTSWIARALVDQYGSVTKIPALSKHENPVSQHPRKWKLFKEFLKLAWFSRVWVLQEVGIARDVIMRWGDAEIRFSDVINVNEFQRHAPQLFEYLPMSWYLHDAFVGLFMWYGNKNSWREQVVPDFCVQAGVLVPKPNIIDTLIQSSRREVTDLRDYIYALLGHPLAAFNGSTIVQADYTRHVDDVYMEVTQKLLTILEPTLPLSVAGSMGKRRPRNLGEASSASWVIRWDLGAETHNLGRPGQWFYAGGKDAKPSLSIDTETRALRLSGVIFDRVKWVSAQILPAEVEINSIIASPSHRAAIQWLWAALPTESRYPDEQARRDAFTLCLVSGRYKHTKVAEDDIQLHRKLARAYVDYVRSVQEGSASDQRLRTNARDFENDYTWTAKFRCMFATEKGFYGIGPQLVQKDDVVMVPTGFMIPFVLRPTSSGKSYRLVGAAYVQGVMRGEVLDEKDPLGLGAGKPRDIEIV
ncbi:hypothetical protein, variant [Verruconis gallopava]|nr:hypothetical protein, variant [Verruconis gallopava]KIV99177.1 hypothetical protein, variant [Verruconis gallopava]